MPNDNGNDVESLINGHDNCNYNIIKGSNIQTNDNHDRNDDNDSDNNNNNNSINDKYSINQDRNEIINNKNNDNNYNDNSNNNEIYLSVMGFSKYMIHNPKCYILSNRKLK